MRLKEFQKYLKEKNIDAALFFSSSLLVQDPYFTYFSGVEPLETAGIIINKTGKPQILIPEIENERVSKQTKHIIKNLNRRDPFSDLKKIVKKKSKIGISFSHLPHSTASNLKKELKCALVDVADKANELRSQKTEKEIQNLRSAAKITDKVFSIIVNDFKKFSTEGQIGSRIATLFKEMGATEAFPSIVASGKNASMPHYFKSGKLRKGFCIIDFGARFNNYCADETRTLYIGKASLKEKQDYELVKKAQQDSLMTIKAGIHCETPHLAAERTLGKESKYFIHSLGHGIGVEVHEEPYLSKGIKTFFKVGNAITVEPGIYHRNKFGIRIEDDYVVTKNKTSPLTNSTRELIAVKAKSL